MDISRLSGSYHPELLEEVEEGKTAAATETTDLTEATEEKGHQIFRKIRNWHTSYTGATATIQGLHTPHIGSIPDKWLVVQLGFQEIVNDNSTDRALS